MNMNKKLQELKNECLYKFIDSKTMQDYLINEKEDFLFDIKEVISMVYNSNRPTKLKNDFLKKLKENFDLSKENSESITRILENKTIPDVIFITDEKTGEFIRDNKGYNLYPENYYVYVPIPFEIGDIVSMSNDDEKFVVVNPNLPTGDIASRSDWMDTCITVVPIKYRNLVTKEYLTKRDEKLKNKYLSGNYGMISDLKELDEISLYHEHFFVFNTELVEKAKVNIKFE